MEFLSKPFVLALVAFLAATIFNILLFLINRKTFKIIYASPIFHIIEISANTERQNDLGEISDRCFIKIQVFNPSSFRNHVKVVLRKGFFSKSIDAVALPENRNLHEYDYFELPSGGSVLINVHPPCGQIEKYKGKNLFLILTDIRGGKARKRFSFCTYLRP